MVSVSLFLRYILTRITSSHATLSLNAIISPAAVKGAQEFKGMADVSRTILREGWNSFYRGIGLRLLQAPLAAIQVGSYGMFRSELARTEKFTVDTIKPLAYFIGSRVLVTTLKSPVEIVKERMQVSDCVVASIVVVVIMYV